MKVPDIFKLKTAKNPKSHFPLPHHHVTTMDFFQMVPLCCREVVPNDEMTIKVRSAVRMFPMPFPTYGNIKFYNRAFFVPMRTIMEGWNEFIDDTDYFNGSTAVRISSVPRVSNNTLADALYDYSDLVPEEFYWRQFPLSSGGYSEYEILTINTGQVALFNESGTNIYMAFVRNRNTFQISNFYTTKQGSRWLGGFTTAIDLFGYFDLGFVETQFDSENNYYQVMLTSMSYANSGHFGFVSQTDNTSGRFNPGEFEEFTVSSSTYQLPTISSTYFDDLAFDFKVASKPYRFNNKGRYGYNLLIRLGYRVNFSNNGFSDGRPVWSSTKFFSACKLLAFVKVYLDYYSPAQYSQNSALNNLFKGVTYSPKTLTKSNVLDIFDEIQHCSYNRDYFTSAWQNPNGPNESESQYNISDSSVVSNPNYDYVYKSRLINYSPSTGIGSVNGTPTIVGVNNTGQVQSSNLNISYYIIEQLRSLTNFIRRHQLAGFRAKDRYLAQFGVQLDDSQTNRSYYLGGKEYNASIQDIMSTADTSGAALGDFAGKGLAYTDEERNPHVFHLRSGEKEFGYVIVIASIVPNSGYVQGIMRENFHLSRMDFYQGDFDNMGTQAIRRDELFADAGMSKYDDPSSVATTKAEDGVFGFVPRYMEYKVGYDFLTGDFAIPSRRKGMDAFHLFRLFPDGQFDSVDRSFQIGEQQQYDRIFNNTNSEYDHFYCVNEIFIDSQRCMKSASDVYDFEHAPGSEISVAANGTTLN